MDKLCNIIDYEGNKFDFYIENFEQVISINVVILSGDEVVHITYRDGRIVEVDANEWSDQERILESYDTVYAVPISKFDEFVSLADASDNAYERASHFTKTDFDLCGDNPDEDEIQRADRFAEFCTNVLNSYVDQFTPDPVELAILAGVLQAAAEELAKEQEEQKKEN